MSSYIIEGGKKLEGEVTVSGSKNASLPIMAATVLNKGISKLYNVPNIHDTKMMIEILKELGCKVKRSGNKVVVDSSNVHNFEISENLMREMRSSVILAGSILGRYKKAIFSYPGGCDIGARPIDLHLKGFEKLGIKAQENFGKIICTAEEIKGDEINLDFPSVGATENIILASVLCNGETIIRNAAMEPEIEDLQNFLNRMGAKIEGAGTHVIKIKGVETLKEVSYNIMPDRIEAGTLLCSVAVTGGKIVLKRANVEHIKSILDKLEEMGCNINIDKSNVILDAPKRLKAIDIKTMPHPGFPTDMQAIFGALCCTAQGTSIITENIFESRFKYMQELQRMGAKVNLEGRTAVIKGIRKLYGAKIKATDLRGGASLVVAALKAKGKTEIEDIKYILRGYENLDEKLNSLGANIKILLNSNNI